MPTRSTEDFEPDYELDQMRTADAARSMWARVAGVCLAGLVVVVLAVFAWPLVR